MHTINFMLGIHNHQPVGNFDSVFHMAYRNCYLPFIEALERHPKIRVSLHYTGPLLEWIESNHPEYFDKLRTLIARRQIELMGGGFYEPLLPVIPQRDALGQIRLLQDYMKEKFNVTPQGMWLAERVWEPSLPSIIARAGLRYVTIDDTHFYYAGFGAEDMSGYYITEDQGYSIAVFPIDKELRYRIPFKLPEETIEYLRLLAQRVPTSGVTLADDGEKFGVWPGTYKWVYEDGYLETLFNLLEENSSWIKMPTFSEYITQYSAMGKLYLPTASYDEMSEWSLPVESQARFEEVITGFKRAGEYDKLRPYLRGGFWRNFLVKYPESNQMYSKMLYVSEKIENSNKNTIDKNKALKELYKSQCNCAYWHGLFGGLYLNYLRHAVYHHLLGAENLITGDKLQVEKRDYNFDGNEEILVSSPDINLYLTPACGGQIIELDYRPKRFNLSNTLTRRREVYHNKIEVQDTNPETATKPKSIHELAIVKEKGLENILFYDWYERNSLIDHILGQDTTLEGFSQCRYEEKGDFLNQLYTVNKCSKSGIILYREGRVGGHPFSIEKAIRVETPGSLRIDYELYNPGKDSCTVWFGIEFNFTLLAGNHPQRYYDIPQKDISGEPMDITAETTEVRELYLVDKYTGFEIQFEVSLPALLWRFPVETVSHSESGLERTYQGSCIMPSWKFTFKPGRRLKLNLNITIKEI